MVIFGQIDYLGVNLHQLNLIANVASGNVNANGGAGPECLKVKYRGCYHNCV